MLNTMELLVTILCTAGITLLLIHEHKLECREYRKKYGMSKSEFRHYCKMMSSSSYRNAKKS